MNENRRINFYFQLKDIAVYTKNLILYKSKQAGADRAHIKSFQTILERRMDNLDMLEDFFNKGESNVVQILRYLENSGEIANMRNGYYMVLPLRNIRLPKSKQVITIGGLSNDDIDVDNFRVMHCNYRKASNVVSLDEYRFDYNLDTWLKKFQEKKEKVYLSNCIFQQPTQYGLREVKYTEIKDRKLYYCISERVADKTEYYVAYKVNEVWYGVFINKNIIKAILALLSSVNYKPYYTIRKLNTLYEIELSNILPNAERDQALLISMPETLNRARKYYVAKNYVEDFCHILEKLKYRREE